MTLPWVDRREPRPTQFGNFHHEFVAGELDVHVFGLDAWDVGLDDAGVVLLLEAEAPKVCVSSRPMGPVTDAHDEHHDARAKI